MTLFFDQDVHLLYPSLLIPGGLHNLQLDYLDAGLDFLFKTLPLATFADRLHGRVEYPLLFGKE